MCPRKFSYLFLDCGYSAGKDEITGDMQIGIGKMYLRILNKHIISKFPEYFHTTITAGEIDLGNIVLTKQIGI